MNTERTETKPSNRRDLPRNNGDSRQVRSAELYKEENTDTTVSSGSTPKLRDSDSNKKKETVAATMRIRIENMLTINLISMMQTLLKIVRKDTRREGHK